MEFLLTQHALETSLEVSFDEVSQLPTIVILYTDYDEQGDAKEETKSLGKPLTYSDL